MVKFYFRTIFLILLFCAAVIVSNNWLRKRTIRSVASPLGNQTLRPIMLPLLTIALGSLRGDTPFLQSEIVLSLDSRVLTMFILMIRSLSPYACRLFQTTQFLRSQISNSTVQRIQNPTQTTLLSFVDIYLFVTLINN